MEVHKKNYYVIIYQYALHLYHLQKRAIPDNDRTPFLIHLSVYLKRIIDICKKEEILCEYLDDEFIPTQGLHQPQNDAKYFASLFATGVLDTIEKIVNATKKIHRIIAIMKNQFFEKLNKESLRIIAQHSMQLYHAYLRFFSVSIDALTAFEKETEVFKNFLYNEKINYRRELQRHKIEMQSDVKEYALPKIKRLAITASATVKENQKNLKARFPAEYENLGTTLNRIELDIEVYEQSKKKEEDAILLEEWSTLNTQKRKVVHIEKELMEAADELYNLVVVKNETMDFRKLTQKNSPYSLDQLLKELHNEIHYAMSHLHARSANHFDNMDRMRREFEKRLEQESKFLIH